VISLPELTLLWPSPYTAQNPLPTSPALVQELTACCLLGKVWGEVLALAAIVNKTKKDWSFLKGQSSFVDIGNDWILIPFASAEDKNLVYTN